MKCDFCRYYPGGSPEGEGYECYHFEKNGTVWKDGREGCTLHPQTLAKEDRIRTECLGIMGTDMGLEHDFEMHGWDMAKVVQDCKHMIGIDNKNIYHRHGKAFYKAYRNGWGNGNTEKPEFEHMCHDVYGFMVKRVSDQGNVFYHMTAVGLKWLSRQINVSIKEEP